MFKHWTEDDDDYESPIQSEEDIVEEKSCDNCGKREDCRTSTATWSCSDNSAWEPIEIEPNIEEVYIVKQCGM